MQVYRYTAFGARKRLRLAMSMKMQLILKYACQFMTAESAALDTHNKLCMYVCICTCVQHYSCVVSPPFCTGFVSTIPMYMGWGHCLHSIHGLTGEVQTTETAACIVIMPY